MRNSFKVVCFACWLLLAGCGAPPPPPPPKVLEPCDTFADQFDEVWNETVINGLELTVRVYRSELDASDGEAILHSMSQFGKEWVEARTSACDTHNQGDTMSDVQYQEVAACLENALATLVQAIDAFKIGQADTLDPDAIDLDSCLSP